MSPRVRRKRILEETFENIASNLDFKASEMYVYGDEITFSSHQSLPTYARTYSLTYNAKKSLTLKIWDAINGERIYIELRLIKISTEAYVRIYKFFINNELVDKDIELIEEEKEIEII